MSEKKRYMKISDGCTEAIDSIEQGLEHIKLICEEMAIEEEWSFEIVEMTEKELLALPEFDGW